MKLLSKKTLTYDDVLLLPGYTNFKREEVDLSILLHPRIKLTLPIISSPMDTVTEKNMAISIAQAGGLGIIHRNMKVETQANIVSLIKKKKLLVGAAIGTGKDLNDRVSALIHSGVDVICIDSGHGFTSFVIDTIKYIKNKYDDKIIIMAGNVATTEGTRALVQAGAEIIRVGMGPGSICTTRVVTGMGVPQLTAIQNCKKGINTKVTIVADGGIKQMGDVAKALGFGADAVMLGSMLARFDESPGKKIIKNGKMYKQYRGMGSVSAMKKGGAERYGQSRNTNEKRLISEGVEGLIEYKGQVSDFLFQVAGSLRSSLYYIGAQNIKEFQKKATFIKISNAGLLESHPHTLTITEAGRNYNSK